MFYFTVQFLCLNVSLFKHLRLSCIINAYLHLLAKRLHRQNKHSGATKIKSQIAKWCNSYCNGNRSICAMYIWAICIYLTHKSQKYDNYIKYVVTITKKTTATTNCWK